MTRTLEKVIVNKLKKSTYDANVESGAITPQMIKEEVWLFNDDQFVSSSDVTNWNNKANQSDIPTKTSELVNDAGFITEADIPTKTSDLVNDSGFVTQSEVPTKTSDLINDSDFVTSEDVPTKTSELINDSGFVTSEDVPTNVSELNNDVGYITNTVDNLVNYTLATETGSQIGVSVDPTTFVMTVSLMDSIGSVIDNASVDLPLESMVIGASYDSENKAIILTLQSGETISVPVADLVDGLQAEITVDNKLASDLVDDTNQTHKFVTSSDKDNWNTKYTKPVTGIPKTDLASTVQTSLDLADTALQVETDPVFTNSPAYGITTQDITDWNNKSDFSGDYNDLTNKPTIPTKTSDLTNDSNFVADANYVHTDNNFTTAEKTKLSGIESEAEVNTIETIKVNGTALTPDQDRAVDITVAGSADNISYDNTDSGLTATNVQDAIDELSDEKVDKVAGKGLSTEDFTTAEKTKLGNIEDGAEVNIIENISVNGVVGTVSNKTASVTISAGAIDSISVNGTPQTIDQNKNVDITVPTKTSDLTNDSNFVADASYVHTDNNFTTAEKTKLSGIEAGAEVNDINTIKVNGTALIPDANKAVNIDIPGLSYMEYNTSEYNHDLANGVYIVTEDNLNIKYLTYTNLLASRYYEETVYLSKNDILIISNKLENPYMAVGDAFIIINSQNGTTQYTLTSEEVPGSLYGIDSRVAEDSIEEIWTIKTAIVPTNISDLVNDVGFITNTVDNLTNYTPTSSLATVATSGDYDDLSNKPTIPIVNNAILTIQRNGTTLDTFTANSSTNKTVDIIVPTKVSDLTNDSGFISGITSNDVTNALGYTPYNSTNPDGFQTASQVNTAIDTKISSTYKAKGSVAFANLPVASSSTEGFVYNVTDSFTTTSDFVEGAGNTYPAGTNVVIINTTGSTYKYDVLAGFVDLSAYQLSADLVAITNAEIDVIVAN